jgi:hypothetical protein
VQRHHPPPGLECRRCGIVGEPEARMNENHDKKGLFASAAGASAGAGGTQSNSPVEITGSEMGIADWRAPGAWRKAYDWAKARFAGKQFVNQATGMTIHVSTKGLKKAASHMPDAKPLKAVAKLPELLEQAAYDHAEAPRVRDGNTRQFHYLRAMAQLEGKTHDVKIVVREDGNGHWFYDHHLTEQKRPV